ncbi:putative E3 ubiquitin-protein ligase ariadne-2 [Pseudolycoriella hygida]|uniref:RBR-type E3 ubiquitin transferase n=1 Tax=Pseudolycoriella hygida TaxID=35572 RepID=A0A9Q0N086_9DIPT|nr:putative E3 ubiquitin-protein ligase ariadne-2 [Pseudolycoriella hygida]
MKVRSILNNQLINMSNDSDMDYSSEDNECEYDYYNTGVADVDIEQIDRKNMDSEYLEFKCLNVEEVEKLLNESVEHLSNTIHLMPSLAKVLLLEHSWQANEIIEKYNRNPNALLIRSRIKPHNAPARKPSSNEHMSSTSHQSSSQPVCSVCTSSQPSQNFFNLSCGHPFCKECWASHFETQINQGISTAIGCMASKCNVRVPEELVLSLLTKPNIRDKYQQFTFSDYVKSHPQLRFCPGANCQIIIQCKIMEPKKATCSSCNISFCFKCGSDYHAPTDCQVIKKWLTKCADDSETANYISAHTKDCPKCNICIEKNGGCNHMQCFSCRYDFCWMCMGDWKTHGSEYYECSRYKEYPNIANESVHAQAREALKKYLHYYERWENHSKSLQLEEQTLAAMRERINTKVMNGLGTWIDWQHLFNAAALLAKCRYTLQYTYPYAYFMEAGSRKDLFEYQQAQLEAEIENLSWKIERAETTDRGDLENQMDVSEKRRITLLTDFFQ